MLLKRPGSNGQRARSRNGLLVVRQTGEFEIGGLDGSDHRFLYSAAGEFDGSAVYDDAMMALNERFKQLERLVMEFVPHLYTANPATDADAEMAYEIDEELGNAARAAVERLLNPEELLRAYNDGATEFLIAVPKLWAKVHVVGVARMRHLPRTGLTLEWEEDRAERRERYLADHRNIAPYRVAPDIREALLANRAESLTDADALA